MNYQRELTHHLLKKKRIPEIDLLRGIPIFLVVLFHFCWSFSSLVYSATNWKEMFLQYPNIRDFMTFLQRDILGGELVHDYIVPLVGGLFIFVCGISSSLTRSNRRRALLLWLAALVISLSTMAVTYITKEDCYISFGVIHVMAFSITVVALLECIFHKLGYEKGMPVWFCLLLSILVFYPSLVMATGYFPLTDQSFPTWPIGFLRGMPSERFQSNPFFLFEEAIGMYEGPTDWWPILPYLGVCFLGVALGKALYGREKKSKMPWLEKIHVLKPIMYIGSHTIWVYLLHQPIIIMALFIIFYCMGFRY